MTGADDHIVVLSRRAFPGQAGLWGGSLWGKKAVLLLIIFMLTACTISEWYLCSGFAVCVCVTVCVCVRKTQYTSMVKSHLAFPYFLSMAH